MSSPKVLIIGCGMAGPVVACLLKQKGYAPIIFERSPAPADVGASLMICPNGLKVLNLIGPVPDWLLQNGPPVLELCDYKASGEVLGRSDVPTEFAKRYGQPAVGVKRTLVTEWLRELAVESGVETAGISPTPEAFRKTPGARNWYGELSHIISYPITHDKTSWGLTLPGNTEEEAAWGLFGDEKRAAEKEKMAEMLQAKNWDPVVLGMVTSAERLIKYGIYDRPELEPEQWYSGRCVMVGDAVHPTSVHLGQGANQACEDCYYLSKEIPDFDAARELRTAVLTQAFRAYATRQQPHTSLLVKGARAVGLARVAAPEFCAQRDEAVTKSMADRAGLQKKFDFTYSRPF
ncbi:3-hydroxybenzoate 6-hydroxylase 1 [Colletotrichum sp. SAR 10_77]|nr:3-hydroxybenzoate 6-hydroxylase 1 [Colletotrichum sp. SAR 10_77]KAJ4998424.1 3-hydroxybenzoate 6-hydroxylase 1 [Colletotrichum sp. SAR 10_66]